MDLALAGRRAFVSASTAGIGLEVARVLAREGVAVTLHGRDPERTAEVAERESRDGPAYDAAAGDLADADGRARVAAHIADGGYDVLVNNAGPFSEDSLDDTDAADWLSAYESNVVSAVELTRAALPSMRARGWGRIVTLGTRGVRTPLPHMIAYSAAKGALQNATTAMAHDVAGTGITVNMVSPGVILTPGLEEMFAARPEYAGRPWPEVEGEITTGYAPNPVGRLGRPSDIAAAIAFLVSDQASYITGVELPVDGGITGTR